MKIVNQLLVPEKYNQAGYDASTNRKRNLASGSGSESDCAAVYI